MRIAVYARETAQKERLEEHFLKWKKRGAPLDTECFLEEEGFLKAVEKRHFDLMIVCVDDSWSGREAAVQRMKEKQGECCIVFLYGNGRLPQSLFQIKYETQFNGQLNVIDAEDIYYLESYARKTSIVMKDKKIRIKGRLDIEEQKFSGYQFARINRWNIINMRYIHGIVDNAVCMKNGDTLYISGSRRRSFLEKYRQYARENWRVV